jgi:hypothetical protein
VDCSRVKFTFIVVFAACAYVGFVYKPHVVLSTGTVCDECLSNLHCQKTENVTVTKCKVSQSDC